MIKCLSKVLRIERPDARGFKRINACTEHISHMLFSHSIRKHGNYRRDIQSMSKEIDGTLRIAMFRELCRLHMQHLAAPAIAISRVQGMSEMKSFKTKEKEKVI